MAAAKLTHILQRLSRLQRVVARHVRGAGRGCRQLGERWETLQARSEGYAGGRSSQHGGAQAAPSPWRNSSGTCPPCKPTCTSHVAADVRHGVAGAEVCNVCVAPCPPSQVALCRGWSQRGPGRGLAARQRCTAGCARSEQGAAPEALSAQSRGCYGASQALVPCRMPPHTPPSPTTEVVRHNWLVAQAAGQPR